MITLLDHCYGILSGPSLFQLVFPPQTLFTIDKDYLFKTSTHLCHLFSSKAYNDFLLYLKSKLLPRVSKALCRLGPACLTCQVPTPCLRSPDSSQKPPVAPSTCQAHPFLTGVSGPWKGAHSPWNRLGQGVGEYTQWNLVLSLKTMVLLLIKATIQGQIIKLRG